MAGWHHRLNGHGFEQALGDGDGQGGLACCSPWGRKDSDTTEQLNNSNFTFKFHLYLQKEIFSSGAGHHFCFLFFLIGKNLRKMVLPKVIYPKKAVMDTHVAGCEYSFSTGAMMQT